MIYVPPQDLHSTWNVIKPGLEQILKKMPSEWIPEDVYSALQAGTSTLHLCYDSDSYEGFVVLTPMSDYDGMTLFIWCGYSHCGNAIEKYFPEIEDLARTMNAKRIRFASPRKGWAKTFSPKTVIYEKEV